MWGYSRKRLTWKRLALNKMEYALKKATALGFHETIEKITALLKDEGFGILTTIDVKDTLQKKIGVEIGDYTILGACNPAFAHAAITNVADVGVFLPCNVIIYTEKGQTVVAAFNPDIIFQVMNHPGLSQLAADVKKKLVSALEKI